MAGKLSVRPKGKKFQVLDENGLILRTLDERTEAEKFAHDAERPAPGSKK